MQLQCEHIEDSIKEVPLQLQPPTADRQRSNRPTTDAFKQLLQDAAARSQLNKSICKEIRAIIRATRTATIADT
eukprot:5382027-Pyramimonas_sp.AAC.1